jgi:hypothetical protein
LYEALMPFIAAGSLGGVLLLSRATRGVLSVRSWPAVWSLGALAALGAVVAPGAPTGLAPFDAFLRATFALACTLAASRAKRVAWILAAGIAAVFSPGNPVTALAFLALGLTVGSILAGRRGRGPVLGALVGAMTAEVLLRLTFSPVFGLTAVAAAVSFGALALSGYRQARRRERRWAARVGGGVGVLAVVALALAGLSVAKARPQADQGIQEAWAGVAAARAGHVTQAASLLSQSSLDLSAAHADLSAWWAWPAHLLPVVAQNDRALLMLTGQGSRATGTAVSLARATRSTTADVPAGSIPIARLEALGPAVHSSQEVLASASATLATARSPWLVPPVAHKQAALQAKVASLAAEEHQLTLATRVLPGLLGAHGPRRYLLVVQDPVEARGGGGIVADWAVLDVDHGHLHLGQLQAIPFPGPGAAPLRVPRATAAWAAGEGFDLSLYPVDDTFSPDFPTDARLLEGTALQRGLPRVDGVVSVDPAALAAVLELTGPVPVAGWPTPLSAANAGPVLLHQQYLALKGAPRQAFLTRATREIFHRFTSTHLPGPTTLARVLGPVVEAGHLRLYANGQAAERLFSSLGAAGQLLPPGKGDFLEVVTQDAGANKIDWYLRRSLRDRVVYDPGTGQVTSIVSLRLTNLAPARGQPQYVIGNPGSDVPPGTSQLLVTAYTPLSFTGGTDGPKPLQMGSQVVGGTHAYSTWLAIPPGGVVTLVMHLDGRLAPGSSYRLRLGEQPLVFPDHVSVSVQSGQAGWYATGSQDMVVRGGRALVSKAMDRTEQLRVGFAPSL